MAESTTSPSRELIQPAVKEGESAKMHKSSNNVARAEHEGFKHNTLVAER